MDIREVFQVLGIAQTRDEREIKNAYRGKLSAVNPEDDPEGFKRLRSAYEQACAYARDEKEDALQEEQDQTPSGLWVEKAARLYENILTRQDEKKWAELFEEDVFLSLEDEENCRRKLLRFVMDHYKLPTDVWKLFDEKMSIVSDASRLREYFPADFIRYIVGKCQRGEDVEFSQFEGEPCAPYDLFLQYYDRCWQALQEEDLKQAAEYIKNADELQIYHPVMEICRLHLLLKEEKKEEAVQGALKLYERYAKDAMVSYNVAEILWRSDEKEQAAKIFQELKAQNDSHYMANYRLSKWYYDNGSYKEAKKCAEAVLSAGADDSFMELLVQINGRLENELEEAYAAKADGFWEAGLELGWCCLQDGKISQGIRLAGELEGKVAKERETERKGLLTKLLIEQAEYEQAIAHAKVWEAALEEKIEQDETEAERDKDKDRIRQARLIRMQSYRNLGYRNRENFALALSEAEAIEKGGDKDVGLLLEKARIYMEMEEYEKSLETVQRLIEDFQVYAAYATSLEVHRRQWNAAGVVQAARQCIQYFPGYVRAYEHLAKVYLDLGYREEFLELLKEAEKNGVESVFLEAYHYQLERKEERPDGNALEKKLERLRRDYVSKVNQGDEEAYQQVLPMMNECLYMFPGTYMLVERGILYRAAHRYEEAAGDFERALAESPAQIYALRGLSMVHKYQGDYEKALICIKKAILYWDEEIDPLLFAEMGILYSLLGDYGKAVEAYREYETKQKAISGNANLYYIEKRAECLACLGKVEKAEKLLLENYAKKLYSFHYEKLSELFMNAGQPEKSRKYLDRWEKELFKKLKGVEKLSPKKSLIKKCDREYADFLSSRAWFELMYGEPSKAMEWFDIHVEMVKHTEKVTAAWCDAAFAAILCQDEEKGRAYAGKLKLWLHKEKRSNDTTYYNRQKSHLQMEILAAWYGENQELIQKLLDKEGETAVCNFCTHCICMEVEAMRILFMLRMGRTKEAKQRLVKNLEKQPVDAYMLAIGHCAL